MKNILFFILASIFAFKLNAQTIEASTTIPTNEYLDLLTENFIIPDSIQQKFSNQDLNLKIVLTITKSGTIFNPQIKNDSLHLESNLKKAFEKLPKWDPKMENGVAVVSKKAFNLSIFIPGEKISTNDTNTAKPEQGMLRYYQNVIKKINVNHYLNNTDTSSEINMVATFIVEKDGSLTNIKIISSNIPSLNNEVIKVIKSMPKWHPATQNNIPIRSNFTLPVKIKINK